LKSKIFIPIFIILLFTGCVTAKNKSRKKEEGFVPIFDGRTLDNWVGDSTYWNVEDGCLTGTITPSTLLQRNSFIVWQGEMPDDFELKVEYRITGEGNSGINYRSEKVEGVPYALRGYQADLDGANNYTGSNYEERKRTTLASQGQKTELPLMNATQPFNTFIKDNQWQPKIVTASLGNTDSLKAVIKKNDWNEYHIIVKGNRMRHFVNDILMSDVTDDDIVNRRFNGLLGVQVHVGPPMKIAYRNFRLKKLK
jgi:hypothetical protein